MPELTIDLFAEDRAHEEFLHPLIIRVAADLGKPVRVRVLSALGGHGRVIAELETYQRTVIDGLGGGVPDILIAAVDANCASYSTKRDEIRRALRTEFEHVCVTACPDPHIERWYLADLQSFHQIVGIVPRVPAAKCDRDFYKNLLASAVVNAGHPPTLGGIEFAAELVEAMDLYRGSKSERSLKHFIDELRDRLHQV